MRYLSDLGWKTGKEESTIRGPLRAAEAPMRTAGRARRLRRIASEDRISRLRAWAFVVIPLGLFVALAAGSPWENPSSWDARLTRYIQGLPDGQHVVSDLFDAALDPSVQLLGGLALLAVAASLVGTSRRRVLFVVLTIAGTLVLEPALKEAIQRPPVDGRTTEYSFPSGHALRSMAGAVALILLLWQTRLRRPAVAGGALAVAIVGLAIVHQDWHWASDVLGGWCLGVAWVALLYLIFRPLGRTEREAREPAP